MKQKINKSNNPFLYTNDAIKGSRKYYKELLEYDVYILGLSYETVKVKYKYGERKPFGLKIKNRRKKFDEAYQYWLSKRQSDKASGSYTGTYTGAESADEKTSQTTTYLIYGLVGVLAIFIIWGIVKKRKK
jgi:hypothetical protein